MMNGKRGLNAIIRYETNLQEVVITWISASSMYFSKFKYLAKSRRDSTSLSSSSLHLASVSLAVSAHAGFSVDFIGSGHSYSHKLDIEKFTCVSFINCC